MSDELRTLLARVLTNPDEHSARLVYADRLNETPDKTGINAAHAELIRRTTPGGLFYTATPDYEQKAAIKKLQSKVFSAKYKRFNENRTIIPPDSWDRGFPNCIRLDGITVDGPFDDQRVTNRIQEICAVMPIQKLDIRVNYRWIPLLFSMPELQHITSLNVYCRVVPSLLQVIESHPLPIKNLTLLDPFSIVGGATINLPDEQLNIPAIEDANTTNALWALARSTGLPKLEVIDLSAEQDPNREIEVTYTRSQAERIRRIARSANLPALRELRLNRDYCTDALWNRVEALMVDRVRGV